MTNRTLPSELSGSRVYLADFDRVTFSQVAWTEEEVGLLVKRMERKWNIFSPTKGGTLS